MRFVMVTPWSELLFSYGCYHHQLLSIVPDLRQKRRVSGGGKHERKKLEGGKGKEEKEKKEKYI